MNKEIIRKAMSEKRNSLSIEEVKLRSTNIYLNLLKIEDLIINKQSGRQLLSFINIKNEVITKEIITYFQNNNSKTAAPKVVDNDMEFYYFSSENELKKGYYNIPEPANTDNSNLCIPKEGDIIIIPGLAFDKRGGRVGYGGGFYDKYLSRYKDLLKIAVAYDFQITDEFIDTDEYDIRPDYIVTDERLFKIQ